MKSLYCFKALDMIEHSKAIRLMAVMTVLSHAILYITVVGGGHGAGSIHSLFLEALRQIRESGFTPSIGQALVVLCGYAMMIFAGLLYKYGGLAIAGGAFGCILVSVLAAFARESVAQFVVLSPLLAVFVSSMVFGLWHARTTRDEQSRQGPMA